ncbi:hypothetical protein ACP4OV_008245 [Aristida adscensionis]
MIQELLGGTAMDQLKSLNAGTVPCSLPLQMLHPMVSNPSPTSSSSTSSRSSAQQPQRSTSATSSPQAQGPGRQQQPPQPGQGAAEQAPLRCPRCNSSNTKFCYYNNYNLTQPRHFCKTCRRYWTKGGALRNVPIGGGCRKPRPMPTPAAKPATCKAVGAAPSLGLGVGGMGAGPMPWVASSPQAATAQLMALLSSARAGVQGHGGGNVHRLLGLDTLGHLPLPVLQGSGNVPAGAGAAASLWPPSAARPMPPPHMDSQLGMGPLGGHHDVLSSLGLKLPASSPPPPASYYSDQLHAVVSNAGRPHEYDAATSLPCTTAVTSLPASVASVSAALSSATVGLDLPPVSIGGPEMQFWTSPATMSVAWPDLPTPNGAFQ